MSKGARLRATRASEPPFRSAEAAQRDLRRHKTRPGVEIAIMPGACVHDEVESMQRQTHDGLIEMLGRRRRSGIWWVIVHGGQQCAEQMRLLYPPEDATPEQAELIHQYYDHFEQCGGDAVLVVASCEAIAP